MVNFGLAFVLWLIAFAIGAGNNSIADLFIAPGFGEYGSHVYKIAVLIVVFFVLAWIYARQNRGATWGSSVLGTGFLWVGLSAIADLILKAYVWNIPRQCPETYKTIVSSTCVLADYYIWEGRLWILLLVSAFLAPLLMGIRANR
ncbi:hypothetical protein [Microcoleus sp. FACHB-672]|uniref:hypothetical protein n=1 Tax=Microcoleus sp. FACHB-672 TaxID=2692825 RepID=UPI0016892B19|nr:hypothetical protein [Microcoleus sp. FACHB-672]MBD2041249.1 hypothetical protein [Microcoleus sp. FACHB-672]